MTDVNFPAIDPMYPKYDNARNPTRIIPRTLTTKTSFHFAVFMTFTASLRHSKTKTPAIGKIAQLVRYFRDSFGTLMARNKPRPNVRL